MHGNASNFFCLTEITFLKIVLLQHLRFEKKKSTIKLGISHEKYMNNMWLENSLSNYILTILSAKSTYIVEHIQRKFWISLIILFCKHFHFFLFVRSLSSFFYHFLCGIFVKLWWHKKCLCFRNMFELPVLHFV